MPPISLQSNKETTYILTVKLSDKWKEPSTESKRLGFESKFMSALQNSESSENQQFCFFFITLLEAKADLKWSFDGATIQSTLCVYSYILRQK